MTLKIQDARPALGSSVPTSDERCVHITPAELTTEAIESAAITARQALGAEAIARHDAVRGDLNREIVSENATVIGKAHSLRLSDRHAASQARLNDAFAASDYFLSACERHAVGGEVRYYRGNKYATVKGQKARWFEVRADGDYAISLPKL